jgi:hypothetical protein
MSVAGVTIFSLLFARGSCLSLVALLTVASKPPAKKVVYAAFNKKMIKTLYCIFEKNK